MGKLRLAPQAFVAPTADHWTVRRGSDCISVKLPLLAALPDRLLELLDGRCDSWEIARQTGLDVDATNALLGRLRRLHLLRDARTVGLQERWQWEAIDPSGETDARSARRDILLVGLGALGLAVLHNFLALELGTLIICDPSLVGGDDIPTYYDDDDRGRRRQQAVLDRLPAALRSRVDGVMFVSGDRDAIARSLEAVVSNVAAVVACSDCESVLASKAHRICRDRGVPFVSAELTMAGAHITAQRPTSKDAWDYGCYSCEKLYRRTRDPFELALNQYAQRLFPDTPPWRYPHDLAHLTTLSHAIMLELLTVLETPDDSLTDGRPRHVFVDFETSSLTARPLARHYACSVCYPRAASDIQSLVEEARRQWSDLQRDDGSAAPPLTEVWQVLQRFVDSEHGIFQAIERTTGVERQALASVFAERGNHHGPDAPMILAHRVLARRQRVRNGESAVITTHGLAFDDVRAAEALAILEGIERLFGLEYCDPARVVSARYSDIESIALDPRDFPLYADFQYEDPAFKIRRFDPHETMEWVCGVRMIDGEPLLVARDLIYGRGSGPPIYLANSSGAACHTSFLRAIVNGLYEAIERDALMVAWFNRLSLPRVTLTANDSDPWQIRQTLASLAFRLTHVDLTNDLGVPVVLAVVQDERGKDFFMATMATAPTKEALLQKLYKELFHFCYPLLVYGSEYRTSVTRARDPLRVVTMADHVCFYQNRRKIRHTAFLTSSGQEKAWEAVSLGGEPDNVKQQLRQLVERLHRCDHDVIVVDCSTPLVREAGLHVVKVLVPGLQPLHAGHRYRVLGGRRVFEVARRMGYADRDRTYADLNPWPHPFW